MPAKGTKLKTGKRANLISLLSYKEYKKTSENLVLYKDFLLIGKTMVNDIFDILLNDLIGFKFNNDIGFVVVEKYRSTSKRLSINFGIFRKTGKVVLHINLHSDGFSYHFKWINKSRFSAFSYYRFILYRGLSRSLNVKVREGVDYKRIDVKDYISYKGLSQKFK